MLHQGKDRSSSCEQAASHQEMDCYVAYLWLDERMHQPPMHQFVQDGASFLSRARLHFPPRPRIEGFRDWRRKIFDSCKLKYICIKYQLRPEDGFLDPVCVYPGLFSCTNHTKEPSSWSSDREERTILFPHNA